MPQAKRTRGKKPEYQLRIARERIEILLNLAEKELRKHPKRSRRYVELTRKIGMRYNVNMPKGFKFKYCRKCGAYLLPSRNVRVRLTGKRLTYQCTHCGYFYRMPIGERRKEVG